MNLLNAMLNEVAFQGKNKNLQGNIYIMKKYLCTMVGSEVAIYKHYVPHANSPTP